MTEIEERISTFKSTLATANCNLVAVSKTKPVSAILEAYNAGQRVFGENKAREMAKKYEDLPKDIQWHMIGHLQRNKIKYIAPFVSLIHGVDSLRLLEAINKAAKKQGRIISCLIQIHIANEDTKFGFSSEEIIDLLSSGAVAKLTDVKIEGLMGMASNISDHRIVRGEFNGLKHLFDLIKSQYAGGNVAMNTLSMGMSGDYKIALEEGSNMVRLGSSIFGMR